MEAVEEEFNPSCRHRTSRRKRCAFSSQCGVYRLSKTQESSQHSLSPLLWHLPLRKSQRSQRCGHEQLKPYCSRQKHRACFRHQGSCKNASGRETQLGFLLSLATIGKRKAVYKHLLLLQQFVNLAHLSMLYL